MSILQKATNKQAFAKVGLFGFQGSGKTHTAMLIALGLIKRIGGDSIAFFDTETGSDWWVNRVPDGLSFYQVKSRAFVDLQQTIRDCQSDGVPILVIDSITHVWRDVIDSFQRKNHVKRLQFHHWGPIKSTWGEYTDAFVNSSLHIIVCGRAGWDYDYHIEEDGSKELIKTGTKMKAETEFGFEPSLVIEMEAGRSPEAGAELINVAHIVKDRSDTINGQSFIRPTFEAFSSHFDTLAIGGDHLGVDTTRNSDGLFDDHGDGGWARRKRIKEEALDEIQTELTKWFPGRTAPETKAKGDIVEAIVGIRAWKRIENNYTAEELQDAVRKIRWFLNHCDRDIRDEAIRAGTDGDTFDANASITRIREIVYDYFSAEADPPDDPEQEAIDEVAEARGPATARGLE